MTLLAGIGLAVTMRRCGRKQASASSYRAVLAMFVVSLVLFIGTDLVGPVVNHLPARELLFLHRMIVGVHFAGVVLGGIGVVALIRLVVWAISGLVTRCADAGVSPLRLPAAKPGIVALAIGVLGFIALRPAVAQVHRYFDDQELWIAQQRGADRADGRDFASLVDQARPWGGRIYAGSNWNWGTDYRVGHVPAHIQLLSLEADGVGFTGRVPALTEQSEARYDPESRSQAEVFDVRWQIRPSGLPGPPGARLISSRGRHNLWWTETAGAMQLAQSGATIGIRGSNLAVASIPFLQSDQALQGSYPLLSLNSDATPLIQASGFARPGSVLTTFTEHGGNHYSATIQADQPALLVVKTSAHPRWSARVDGRAARIRIVAPGLLAVEVPAGTHYVDVTFGGFPLTGRAFLVVVGIAAITAVALIDYRRRGEKALAEPTN